MLRVADYIIYYILEHGTNTIFTLAGGGAMFLNDAVAKNKKMKYICCHHEQSCSFAAEAYAKLSGKMGVCMVTSGPGSTNAITGLLEAYQNSIPVLFLSSQAKKSQMGKSRQFGAQEVSIIPIVDSITKYAAVIKFAKDAKLELDLAYEYAFEGRPGPVWLDVPIDIAQSEWKT